MILDLEQSFKNNGFMEMCIEGDARILNIKPFLMENLTIIMGLMMRERFRNAN